MTGLVRQRDSVYRNRKLLDLSHWMPCQATFAHTCNQGDGCHPAHANWLVWGKGVGHKSPDWAFAAVCGNAHRELDGKINPTMDREQRQAEWLRAFIATQDMLWKKGLLKVT